MQSDDELRAKLNTETAKIPWRELERHYARGVVVRVDRRLDLVEVALRFARDDRAEVEGWLASGGIGRASETEAADWATRDPTFWAVVTAPWVLIQEVRDPT